MKRPEQHLQRMCVKWFNYQYPQQHGQLFMCHQNGKNAVEQAILKSIGLVPGVSDLIYLTPSGAIFIEMKTDKGRQSDAQKQWQQKVEALGYAYHIVRSVDEFINLINNNQ